MAPSTPSGEETASIDFQALRIRESEVQPGFHRDQWKSLKMRLAATPATDLSGVAAKLRIVHDGIRFDADQLDLNIIHSAIADLRRLSKTAPKG